MVYGRLQKQAEVIVMLGRRPFLGDRSLAEMAQSAAQRPSRTQQTPGGPVCFTAADLLAPAQSDQTRYCLIATIVASIRVELLLLRLLVPAFEDEAAGTVGTRSCTGASSLFRVTCSTVQYSIVQRSGAAAQ